MNIVNDSKVLAMLKQSPDIFGRVEFITSRVRARFGGDVPMTLVPQIVPETGDYRLVLCVQRPAYSRDEARFLDSIEAESGDFTTELSLSLVFSEVLMSHRRCAMSHQALKAMLISNPNAFWDFVNAEGLTEAVVAVLDEADRDAEEAGGSLTVEISPLINHQVFA